MKMVCLMILLAVCLAGSQPLAVASSPEPVAVFFLLDRSPSMTKELKQIAESQSTQARLVLLPGDFIARIPFSDRALSDVLSYVHTVNDISNVTEVLKESPLTDQGWTLPSVALKKAKKHIVKAGDRFVLIVLVSDCQIAARSSADNDAELRELKQIAEWWRTRPNTRIVIVRINRGNNGSDIARMKQLLGAEVVTPATFASASIVVRTIRAVRPATTSRPVVIPRKTRSQVTMLPMVCGLVLALALGGVVYRRKANRIIPVSMPISANMLQQMEEATLAKWEGNIEAFVTVDGETIQTLLSLPDEEHCPDGVVTLGRHNCSVPVPTGVVVELRLADDEIPTLALPDRRSIIVDNVTYAGGTIKIHGDQTELLIDEVHVLLGINEKGGSGNE